jgi:hypothetical protein
MDPADTGRRAVRGDSGCGTGFPRDVGNIALRRNPGARLADGVQVVCPGDGEAGKESRAMGGLGPRRGAGGALSPAGCRGYLVARRTLRGARE